MGLSWLLFLIIFFFIVSPAISIYGFPSDSVTKSLHIALDRALYVQSHVNALGPKCQCESEKAAWDDCVELHESIVMRINQALDPTIKSTSDDVQTWLSAALTFRETCRQGFLELGVTMPLIFKNDILDTFISDCLAQNIRNYNVKESYKDGFPTWLSVRDRKLLQSPFAASQADIVVAKNGSGNYTTIGEAIKAAKNRNGNGRFIIYVKEGTYNEIIVIKSKLITLVGDGIGKTIITGSNSNGTGFSTFKSATVAISNKTDGFTARGITIKNTAGPQNHQAVALRSDSDRSAFYQCSFDGYQDTLYVHANKQFYKECDIYGTVDFIFGDATAVFQNCNIFPRNPPNKVNTITAQGRKCLNQTGGFSIHNSTVKAAPDLVPVQDTVKTYLGRPWQKYSRTVFMKTFLDSLIDPEGWKPWNGDFALNTLYYGEYNNTGPGSSTANRVNWTGYHVITSPEEASNFTVGKFFDGDSWLPDTNIPYNSSL